MSRNPTRSRRARPAASSPPPAPNGSGAAVEPLLDGWQRSLDISRAMLGVTLGSSQAWVRGLGEWQEAQAASLREASERMQQWAGEAEAAPDWPALWALQANLAGAQWTQAMQACAVLVEQAMQIEARLVERSRADAALLSKCLLPEGEGGGNGRLSAPQGVETATPQALLEQVQDTMNQVSRLWTQAFYNTSLPD